MLDAKRIKKVYQKHLKSLRGPNAVSEAHNRTLDELGGKYAGTDESGARRRAIGDTLRSATRGRSVGKPKRKGTPGSVSWGTMRDEDLIPAFMEVLDHCWPSKAKRFRAQNKAIFRWLDAGAPSFSYTSKAGQSFAESLSNFVNEDLFDALNQCAPRGHYFGSSEGDGSDYGFWSDRGDF